MVFTSAPQIPCILNVQCNGRNGVSFTDSSLTWDQVNFVMEENFRNGVVPMPTLITNKIDQLVLAMTTVCEWYAKAGIPPESGLTHLECFALSKDQRACGAHNPALMAPATIDNLDLLIKASEVGNRGKHRIGILTMAVDAEGDPFEVMRYAKSKGIKVLLAHQVSTPELLRKAFKNGAEGYTHFGNAKPAASPRESFLFDELDYATRKQRGADVPPLFTMITDGIHTRESLNRIVIRLAGTDNVIIVGDDSPHAKWQGTENFEVLPGVTGAVREFRNEFDIPIKTVVVVDSQDARLAGAWSDGLDCSNNLVAMANRWEESGASVVLKKKDIEKMIFGNACSKILRCEPKDLAPLLARVHPPRFDIKTQRFVPG